MKNIFTVALLLSFLTGISSLSAQTAPGDPTPLKLPFVETFEDNAWEARGWYDSPQIRSTDEEAAEGKSSCVWHWVKKGDSNPSGKGGRVLFEPTESVTLSFALKHSENWTWTGKGYHPHAMLFMSTEDTPHWGPAYTCLTFYIEVVDGIPRCGVQDGRNIDTTALGKDLTAVTEKRSVGGGNGDPDGHGAGGYYRSGKSYWNGRLQKADKIYFSDEKGPLFKGDWHRVKAHFKLNSIGPDGKARHDGVMQYWYDDKLLMDYQDMVFRTGAHPDMKLNQFLMLPHYGPGVPHEQKIWVDDLKITQ